MKTTQLDFRELLSFNPLGGVILFLGQRVYLMDAAVQSLLRKEMIETLGQEMVSKLLTRSAYSQGWRITETVKKELPDVWLKQRKAYWDRCYAPCAAMVI
ncbi:MAG: XylR N-terminal domain-containing protein [Desulfuromonadaceae bacterium]|nr:XylR N-terminal domain-containing protein [Desulfuromonadaceae bacterium]